MADFFISYSSKDQAEADFFYNEIVSNGYTCFMAPNSLGNSTYAKEVPGAIKECKVFVLIISLYSQQSAWVQKELDMALNNNKTLLPISISSAQLTPGYKLALRNVRIINYHGNKQRVKNQLPIILDLHVKNEKEAMSIQKADTSIINVKEILEEMTKREKQSGDMD